MASDSSGKRGVSMLDKMASTVVTTKADKAPKRALTPLAGEKVVPLTPVAPMAPGPDGKNTDLPGQFMAGESLVLAARSLRAQARQLEDVAHAIDLLTGESTADVYTPADPALAQKAQEREADRKAAEREKAGQVSAAGVLEKVLDKKALTAEAEAEATEPGGDAEDFQDRMARLTADAQAATFKGANDDTQTEDPDVPVEAVSDGDVWVCPEHGNKSIEVKVSPRRGVSFRKCMEPEHEKPGDSFEKV